MGYYDLSEGAREQLKRRIHLEIQEEMKARKYTKTISHFSNDDTYIRKNAYLSIGTLYKEPHYKKEIIALLLSFIEHEDVLVRQSAINAAGEIAKLDFDAVVEVFDIAIKDKHYFVRNAVIGSLKKSGKVNIKKVLHFIEDNINDNDHEIRRQMVHGLESVSYTHLAIISFL